MANKNDVKVTFNADVKPFNEAIQKSNSEMSKLRAELKLNETQMKLNGASAEGLEEKHKILQSQYDASQAKVNALNAKIETATRYYGENSNEVIKLQTQLANAMTAHEKLGRAVNEAEVELNAFGTEAQDTRTATEKLTDTIQEQENELAQLKSRYSDYVIEGKEATQEAKDLESAIGRLSNELKSSKSALSDASNKADELAKSFNNVEEEAEQAESGFTIMQDAIGDLVADGINVAIDAFKELMTASSEASASLQAATGASTAEMEKFNAEMEELYANNYGESLKDVADKMSYVAHATDEVDPTKIRQMTENAMALEDTFGSDFNETIRGVSNMMRHFGIDAETAFDLFAKGSQEGLDYTGELGDNIAEYGGNFALAGYSAEEYFQLLKNGAEGGAYNLDKVNDSINEVKARLADGTIDESLGMFSEETQELFYAWDVGAVDMKEVIESIVKDIDNTADGARALTMAQVAFGTMGEDANLDVVRSLTMVGDSFDDVKGKMEEVKNVKYSDVGNQFAQIGRMIRSDLIQPLVDVAMPAIQGFASFIIENFEVVGPIITGVAVAFGVLAGAMAISNLISAVQKAFTLLNTTMLANPIVLIVALLAGLVAAFITLWNNCEGFRNFWINLWNNIKSITSSVINNVKERFTNMKSSISSTFNSIKSTATTVWNAVKNAMLNPIENAKNKITTIINTIKKLFSGLKLKMPKIQTPKFSISPKGWKIGDLLKGSIPKLSITWHKDGAIFRRPTLFDTPNGFHGVGEAGAEAVLPIEKLENYVVNAIEKTQQRIDFSGLANAIEHLANRAIELKLNGRTVAETIANDTDNVNGLRNALSERGLILG